MTTLGLEQMAGRCGNGYALVQHPDLCDCGQIDEWTVFRRAVYEVARANNGLVPQSEMRARIRGHIESKHIGGFYTRAKHEDLIHVDGYETSDDKAGKNAGRLEPRYRLGPNPH